MDCKKIIFQGLESMAPRSCECEGTALTDGVSLCVRFAVHRPRSNSNRILIVKQPSECVVGIDPERVDVVLAVEILPDGNTKQTKLSAGKHHHDSVLSVGLYQGVKWRKSAKDIDLLLQNCSCETVDDEQL